MLKALRNEKEAGDLLGTYLLQGWIMTDQICSVEGCSFPLMRSKDGSLSFCTHHDTLPNTSAQANYKSKPVAEAPKAAIIVEEQPKPIVEAPVVDDMQDELQIRRQRREQSSKASQLIGQKMLQRWALLNEHCPNDSCYAVPLVRNPDTKKMFCVICENIILTEAEALQVEKNKKEKGKEAVTVATAAKAARQQEIEALMLQSKKFYKEQEEYLLEMEQHGKEIEQPNSRLMQQQQQKQNAINVTIKEEPKKRQKTATTSASTTIKKYDHEVSDYFSFEVVVSTLSRKMNELTERTKECDDSKELAQLFKSIKSCAGAIQACVEAGQAYDKISGLH